MTPLKESYLAKLALVPADTIPVFGLAGLLRRGEAFERIGVRFMNFYSDVKEAVFGFYDFSV